MKAGIGDLYFDAIENGDLDKVQLLVSQGVDIHYQEDYALIKAINFSQLEILKYLVETLKLDPAKDHTCLMMAASKNDVCILKFLLETCQCDVASRDNIAIRNAIMMNSFEAMKYLQSQGASLFIEEVVVNKINQKLYLQNNNIHPDNTSLYDDNFSYLASACANCAWFWLSDKCMPEILEKNHAFFFSDDNIQNIINTQKIVLALKKKPDMVNYVMERLFHYHPEKIDTIELNAQTVDDIEVKEYFNNWYRWFKLELTLTDKVNIKTHKI